jgi:lipopolysaccharide export system permease protein
VIIFRYLSREVIVTMVAVSSILLLIIMSGRFVRYLAEAATGNLSVDVLFTIMGYRLPGFLELVVPLGFFIAILLAYGRLYTDSEMVVLSACGLSQNQLLAFTMAPALAVAVVVGSMSLWVSPMGVLATETVLAEQRTRSEFDLVQPGRFQPLSGGDSISYVEGVSDDRQRLQGVFVAESGADTGQYSATVVVAEYGEQSVHDEFGQRYLNLHHGRRYEGQPGQADFQVTEFDVYGQYLPPPDTSAGFRNKADAIPTADLWGAEDLQSRATLQWRLSLPVLVLVVAFLAVPLSSTSPRRGRYVKMLPAIILYMVYLGALSGVRGAIEAGNWPVVPGLWVVHPIFIGLALLLLNTQNLRLWRQKRHALAEARHA